MAKKKTESVPQFTIPFTHCKETNGETKYTEIEFSHPSEAGSDYELTDDESGAFDRVVRFYGSGFDDGIPDHHLLANWWHEFLRSPLRNVRIGTDEFRRSRAGLIPHHELLCMSEYAGVEPANIGNHSVIELLNLMFDRCCRDQDNREAAVIEFVDSDYAEPIGKSELAYMFGVDVATVRRRIKSGELRIIPGTSPTAKKIRVHGDDFPPGLKRQTERKLKLSLRPKRAKRQ